MTYKVICVTSTGEYVPYHGHSALLALNLQSRLVESYLAKHRGSYYDQGLNIRAVARGEDGHEVLMSGFEIGVGA